MQSYGRLFARVYNTKWAHFANQVGPRILDFYERTDVGRWNKSVLDLCCGTGQLALYFLNRGYKVIGIDLSESMLHIAKRNAGRHLETGKAEFRLGNATDFSLESPVGLVTSTFDSLNHLDGEEAVRACFRSVFSVLVRGGHFIFDLNTRAGLKRWNNIFVDESTDEAMVISRASTMAKVTRHTPRSPASFALRTDCTSDSRRQYLTLFLRCTV